jgi:hypothetical protein
MRPDCVEGAELGRSKASLAVFYEAPFVRLFPPERKLSIPFRGPRPDCCRPSTADCFRFEIID